MVLHSTSCKGETTRSDSAGELQGCISCRSLHLNTTVMGIRHRALDGAHKNTPWSYLGFMQLARLLNKKNHQNDALQLHGLNAG